jgi:hypothetical protein
VTARPDDVRAAAALLACTAIGSQRLQQLILTDIDDSRSAAIAVVLAYWLAEAFREYGADPVAFARQAIADSIADEATGGTP